MEVPRLGVESELRLPAYIIATATQDLSCICDLHSSLWQHWILNPLIEAQAQAHILRVNLPVEPQWGTPEHFFKDGN